MRAIQNAGGHVGLSARNYPVEATAAISAGQVVKLSGGLVVCADTAETGPILGIAAENHSGAEDVMNRRANGTEILVYDDPALIFECPAPVFEAASGTGNTIVPKDGEVNADAPDDAFNGAVVRLAEKGPDSQNTAAVGTAVRITDYAADGTVMTKESGFIPSAGDKFELYPQIGGTVGGICALNQERTKLVLTAGGLTKIRCIGHDFDRHMLRLMATEHSLGVEN